MQLFESERLVFTELTCRDLDALYSLLGDAEVMRHCGGAMDKNGAQRWLEAAIEAYSRFGYDYWAAYEKATGAFVGQMGIMNQPIEGTSMDCLAYMVARAYWGRGYATEGAAACIRYGFDVLGLDRIHATVQKQNAASTSVLCRIGMGYVREVDYCGETALLYAISKSDFLAANG